MVPHDSATLTSFRLDKDSAQRGHPMCLNSSLLRDAITFRYCPKLYICRPSTIVPNEGSPSLEVALEGIGNKKVDWEG